MALYDITIGFSALLYAVTSDLGVWWILAPIILLWIIMEFYFGEYKQEQLGFSSTLANGVSLFWISLTSFRVFLFIESEYLNVEAYKDPRVFLLGFFVLYALLIMYVSFTHRMGPHALQLLAGPSVTYFFSMLSVLWGQRLLEVSVPVVSALVVSFVVINIVFFLIRHMLGFRGEVEHIRNLPNNHEHA
jgi:hypothetical protein